MSERIPGGSGPEGRPSPEQEPVPYHRAARFSGERLSGRAYQQAQDAVFSRLDSDLSVYRLQINAVWHVIALGESPSPTLARRLETILAAGEAVTLPRDVLLALAYRRAQASRLGPWIERHHRPGERL